MSHLVTNWHWRNFTSRGTLPVTDRCGRRVLELFKQVRMGCLRIILQHTAIYCKYTETHCTSCLCDTLQHTATHCNKNVFFCHTYKQLTSLQPSAISTPSVKNMNEWHTNETHIHESQHRSTTSCVSVCACVCARACVCVCVCVCVCIVPVMKWACLLSHRWTCDTLTHTHTHTHTHTWMRHRTATHCDSKFSITQICAICSHVVEVCCSVLQCVAEHPVLILNDNVPCGAGSLHPTATHYNTQQHTATHSNTQQHTATHCNTLQCVATSQP